MPFCGKRAVYLPLLFTIDPTGKRACASCVTIIVSRYFLFYPLFLLFRLLRFKYFSRPPPLIVRRATVPLLFQSDTFPSFVITIKLYLPFLFRFSNAIPPPPSFSFTSIFLIAWKILLKRSVQRERERERFLLLFSHLFSFDSFILI